MSNYTQSTNFATKDALSPGDPLKIVRGTEINTEFTNIAIAVATKLDTTALASPGPIGATTPAAISCTSLNGGQLAGLRNKIINGGMQVAQRDTATLTAAYKFGSCDRWQFICSGGTGISGTIYQNTITSYSTGYAGGVSAASWTTGQFFAQQRIEAKNVQDLNSKTVTVSCKVFQDTGGTRSWSISLVKPTALDNWGSQTSIGSVVAGSSTTGAVATISASFTLGATDASNGLGVLIFDNVANTVVSKIYLVGDVQLEVGPVATPFEQRPYGMELALCKRYLPAASTGDVAQGVTSTTSGGSVLFRFEVEPRIPPTGISFTGTASLTTGTVLSAVTAITFSSAGSTMARLVVTGTGTPYAANQPIILLNAASLSILFTGCEL